MTALSRATLAASLLMTAAGAAEAQTSLTIYNDGRVLVRRVLPLALAKGVSTQRLQLNGVEPGSLVALDDGVSIARATYDQGLAPELILRRLVGQQVTLERPRLGGGYEATALTVLGADPLRFRWPDGTISFGAPPGQLRFPASAVPEAEGLAVTFESAQARTQAALGWFTGGAQWQAAYTVILGGKTARVTGQAQVTLGTLDVEDAEVQLLAGSVNRAVPAPSPKNVMMARAQEMAADAAGYAGEQRAGEFHLYTIPGRTTLRAGTTSTIGLFAPATAPVEKRLTVPASLPMHGYVPQMPDEQPIPVSVQYVLTRVPKTAFGDLPLPAGIARVFEADAQGRLQLVGEANTGHTAAGQELRLEAGEAFDFTAKRTQVSYATRQEPVPGVRGASRTVATMEYRVVLSNATGAPQVLDVLEERAGEWSVTASSVPAEKLSSTRTRFKVTVPARGDATLTYTLRATW